MQRLGFNQYMYICSMTCCMPHFLIKTAAQATPHLENLLSLYKPPIDRNYCLLLRLVPFRLIKVFNRNKIKMRVQFSNQLKHVRCKFLFTSIEKKSGKSSKYNQPRFYYILCEAEKKPLEFGGSRGENVGT